MPIDSELAAKLIAQNKIITDLKAKVADLENQIKKSQAKLHFGDWVFNLDIGVQYPATTDGFVCITVLNPPTDYLIEICAQPPDPRSRQPYIETTVRQGQSDGLTMPVRAGDVWWVAAEAIQKEKIIIQWIPLITG